MSAPYLPLNAYGSSDAGKFMAGLNLPGLISNIRGMVAQKNADQERQIGLQLALRNQYMHEQEAGYHGGVKPPSIAGGGDPYGTAQQQPGNQTQAGGGSLGAFERAPQVPMQGTPTSGGEPGMVAPSGQPNQGLGQRIGRFLGVHQAPTLEPLGPRNGYSQTEADDLLQSQIDQNKANVEYGRQLNILGINHEFEAGQTRYVQDQMNKRAKATAIHDDARFAAGEKNADTRALMGSFTVLREQALGRLTDAEKRLQSLQRVDPTTLMPAGTPDEINAATQDYQAARDAYLGNDKIARAVVGKLRPDLVGLMEQDAPSTVPPTPQTDAGPSSPALRALNAQAVAALRAAKTQAERNKIIAHYQQLVAGMK